MRSPVQTTLRAALADWVDIDVACYSLVVALGLIDPETSPLPTKAKHVFWTDHPVGNFLSDILERLTSLGVVERRDEPDIQFRWNAAYRGSWE
jgi:hypothetical protein